MDPVRKPIDIMPENLVDLGDDTSLEFCALRVMVRCGDAMTPQRLATLLGVDEAETIMRFLCEQRLVYCQDKEESLYGVDPLAVFLQIEKQDKELTGQFKARKRQLAILRKHARSLTMADQHVLFPEESIRLPLELTMSYTRHAMSHARSEVAISSYRFDWFYAVKDILHTKIKEGLSLTVVIADPDKAELFRTVHKETLQRTINQLKVMNVKVHLLPEKPVFRGTLIDNEICLLTMYDPNTETADDCSVGLLLLKEPTIISLVQHYFKTIDDQPEKNDLRIEESDDE